MDMRDEFMKLDITNKASVSKESDAEYKAQHMTLAGRKSGLAEFLHEYENQTLDRVAQNPYRCHQHLMAPVGWLNDPNGLSYFGDRYHVFFQYSPFAVDGGMKMWGHYTSKDLIHYEYAGTPFLPDESYDKDGVYSGSAIVHEGRQYIFYTGNVKEEGEHDFIHSGRGANVIRVVSEDGMHFSEKKCIITNADYPAECTNHVRDPKLFRMPDGSFRMVLGARLQDERGAVLLYSSEDLETFSFEKMITAPEAFGYMWECPDIFELSGKQVLAVCPQGVPSESDRYQNIYQSGYFIENDMTTKNDVSTENDTEQKKCSYTLEEREAGETIFRSIEKQAQFIEWDMGFDFYAPQTFETPDGRRILIGWAGVPDAAYSSNPYNEGWQHCLTLPRELTFESGKIYQRPVRELAQARKNKLAIIDRKYNGKCDRKNAEISEQMEDKMAILPDGCGEVIIDGITEISTETITGTIIETITETENAKKDISDLVEMMSDKDSTATCAVQIGSGLIFTYADGVAAIEFTDDSGAGRKRRTARVSNLTKLHIMVDVSIVEIYINDGEVVMTTRIFDKNKEISVRFAGQAEKVEAWISE